MRNEPPIPSPWIEPEPQLDLTRRIEWDVEAQHFYLAYYSPLAGRLRCEWLAARHNPFNMIGLVPFFPIFLIILLLTQLLRSKKRPNQIQIFIWGVRDVTPENTGQFVWAGVKEVINDKGDILIMRKNFYESGCYITRENFASIEESQRFEAILNALAKSNGQAWDSIVSQFAKH